MRVGLNATCFNNRPSGARQRFVGIYGELIKQLPDSEFVVYEPQDCQVGSWFADFPNAVSKRTPIPSEGRSKKIIQGWRYWEEALKNSQFDFFERFNLPVVKAPTGKTLMTVHDIRGVVKGNFFRKMAYKYYEGHSFKAADHVITVSHSIKNEILDYFPGTPITVIYNGLNPVEFSQIPESALAAFQIKYDLPKSFMLCVGHLEKRKNYLRLIDALLHLKKRRVDCPLLIIGNDSGERQHVESKIVSSGLERQVLILNGLTDQEVRCAYRLCSLFVFPSAYEGFGIPILEAMGAQCPLVLSDLPVFREITEGQSIYFPYDDAEAMADAIELGLTSSVERERIVAYGDKRVGDFSFAHLGKQLANLYVSLSN